MNAIVSCKDHDHSKRDIYDICETNESGETALQVYCRAYKQASFGHGHGLLRKARRLDSLLNVRHEATVPASASVEPRCNQCSTEFSPAFYLFTADFHPLPPPDNGQQKDRWVCHRCHFESNESIARLCHVPSYMGD